MKDKETLHRRVIELADCYATSDPLREMSVLAADKDKDEAALKWLALAAIHGVNANAKEISITKTQAGEVKVGAKYNEAELPSPGEMIGGKIIEDLRAITHLDKDKDKTILALGIRDSSIDITVKIKRDDEGEKCTLKFNRA